eukprot:scaffold118421_cov34-Prasinocladus_malaysianus.AAC.2
MDGRMDGWVNCSRVCLMDGQMNGWNGLKGALGKAGEPMDVIKVMVVLWAQRAVSAMVHAVEAVFSSPGYLIGGFMSPRGAGGGKPGASAAMDTDEAAALDHGLDMDAVKQVKSTAWHDGAAGNLLGRLLRLNFVHLGQCGLYISLPFFSVSR